MWNRFTQTKLINSESSLLNLMGRPFTRQRVAYGEDDYVTAIECGEGFPIVLLHGYGGGAAIFFSVIKILAENYRVISVDLPGMGMSSRPPFEAEQEAEAKDFFIKPLERLFDHLGLSRFILLGHSFGGFIASCYAIAHPDQIESLILVSTVGIASEPVLTTLSANKYQDNWLAQGMFNFVSFFWERKFLSPGKLISLYGPASKSFLDSYMQKFLKHTAQPIRKYFVKYIEMINLLPPSGEFALTVLFRPGVWAVTPLSQSLKKLTAPILFIRGSTDWVTIEGALETSDSPSIVQVTVIEGASHHLYIENPEELCNVILDFVYNFSE
jgi:pimeloyl-ACP methyl ester carboxylesterase